MAIDENDVKSFFEDYGRALGARNAKAIAQHWAAPSFVLSDQGGLPVGSIEDVEAFFASSMQQYEGVAEARAKTVSVTKLSENVVTAAVEWEHKDSSGDTVGGERGVYMLNRHPEGHLAISVYAPILEA